MAKLAADLDFAPRPERETYRERWLRDLIRNAYEHAPAARERIPSPDAPLDQVRVTRKDELIDLQKAAPPFGGFLGVPMGEVARVFMSPGPLFDPQGLAPDYWRWGPALRAAGFGAGDVVHCAVSFHGTPLGWMFDDALREFGCTVVPAGVGATELQVHMLRGLRTSGFVGTPSALKLLYEKAEELGLDPRVEIALRHAFVAGEMLPPSLRAELQSYGPTVCQGYGTADLGCLGYECLEQNGMHVPADACVEILDPGSGRPVPEGEVGEVVATVNERTYPLVRFGTGDLSRRSEDPCPCGRTAPRLLGIVGRVGEGVKVRGMFVHPRQVDEVVARFPEVGRYRLVVTRSGAHDELLVEAECVGDASVEGLAERLGEALRDLTRVRADVSLLPHGSIAADAKKIEDRRRWE
jgi:phenylacetate-CoA ligase